MKENKLEFLEKELETLKKDYGRLCQNDSVMRKELSIAFKRLDKQDKEIKELKLLITNLHQECKRLYSLGFSNGVEVAKNEYAAELKRLEDTGLISCHGFLKKEPNDELDKLSETIYNQLGVPADKLEPASATKMADEAWYKWADPIFSEHYKQVDKAVKCEKECSEPECKDSCEYLIMFHNAFDNSTAYKCTKLNKITSIPDGAFISLSPADFKEEKK